MRLKLDENLGAAAAAIFGAAGHDVSTVKGEHMAGAADRTVFAMSRSERRCLVTMDLDFGNPLLFKPEDSSGIAVLRLPPKASYQDILDACRTLIGALARGEITGKLWIIQRGRIREYQPDLPEEEDD
jgi:hypothetical protein